MTSPALEKALTFVLRWEGGYVDHPDDPGGTTNRGVTAKVYAQWRQQQGLPARDVKLIDDAEVDSIYETGYWLPPRCDFLPGPLEVIQFDTAVNMGAGRAIRFLQAAVGCPVDGGFGPGTEKAVAACDRGAVCVDYCNRRETYYRELVQRNPKLAVFLKGWLNRLGALRHEAGLPGFEAADRIDFGDTSFIARVPDVGLDPAYD